MYHRILAAYDGSAASDKALQHAVAMARSFAGSRLTVLHVIHRPVFSIETYGWVVPAEYMSKVQEYSDALLRKAEEAIASLPYAAVHAMNGSPGTAILSFAEDSNADLIVMGSRGLGAFQEWMLGSVSHHVVSQARVPVLIVK